MPGLCYRIEKFLNTAKRIKDITSKLKIPFIFKASFDKANRMSLSLSAGRAQKRAGYFK